MSSEGILSPSEWRTVVETCLGTSQVDVLKISVGPLAGEFGGFLGDHRQVKVKVLVHTSKPPIGKELAFFLKRIPDDHPKHTEFVTSCGAFNKEIGLLSKLFNRFPRTSIPWGPECYFTRPDTLVLEDLIEQQFRHVPRHALLDYPHCAVFMKTLAVYHAATLIFEENQSKSNNEKFKINEKYPDLTYELLFAYEGTGKFLHLFKSSVDTLNSIIDLVPKYKDNENVLRKISEKLSDTLYQQFELSKPSKKFRNVLCHGDLWVNNVFFRYQDDVPVEVRIVDFQVVRYCPPATDIMAFLHLNTGREFREANEEKLLLLYHTSLAEELSKHGYQVDQLLPWSEFKESCEVYRAFGRIIAACYHHVNMLPKRFLDEHMEDPYEHERFLSENRAHVVAVAWEENDHYRGRLLDDLTELIDCMILGVESNSSL
ncbi:uncharacterized protein [Anabrus simplex]|uniref:uncharacterized protein n=1 Tax=Anabrus simplex TaxID=316456 RepID=UPI0035A27A23